MITFAITFLSPGYINNPFLKAKLVAVSSSDNSYLAGRTEAF